MIDARGPRWSAGLTSIVLIVALITRSPIVIILQLVQFGIAAFAGPPNSPYAWLYKNLVQPRLSKNFESEPVRPVQFAQLVGFIFAAFLNSAFGYCLGCKMYLLGVRFRSV